MQREFKNELQQEIICHNFDFCDIAAPNSNFTTKYYYTNSNKIHIVQHNIPTSHSSLYRTSSMASVATVTGGPITKEEDDKGEEGLLFLLEVAGFEQVAPLLAF